MTWLRAARAIGGLLAIVTLLGLVAADVVYSEIILDEGTLMLLLGIIGVLLGVDMLAGRLPIELTVGERDGDEGGPE